MGITNKHAEETLREIWSIYHDYGIYEFEGTYYDKYHDTMLTQSKGASLDFNETLSDIKEGYHSSWESTIDNLDDTLAALKLMKEIHVKMSLLHGILTYG